jgi:hypothetical protein
MERSKFENIGDPQLRKYANYVLLITRTTGALNNISEFYNIIMFPLTSQNTEISKKILAPVGGSINRSDIEYLYYIIINNNLLDGDGPLDRPTLTVETIDFVYEERVFRTVTHSGDVQTYLPGDLTSGYLITLKEEGIVDPWSWKKTGDEEEDWDVRDFWFDV